MLVCSWHGLQWLWPYTIAYEPNTIAILDIICVVQPDDNLQQDPKERLDTVVYTPFLWILSEADGWFSSFAKVPNLPKVCCSCTCTAAESTACVAH